MDPMKDLPMGFGMALAQNTEAMRAFCHMSPEKQQKIVAKTQSVHSKAEMKALVNSFSAEKKTFF